MDYARNKFEEIFAAFVVPHARNYHATKGGLGYWGKAAGLSAEDIIARAHEAGVKDHDKTIRSGWDGANPQFINGARIHSFTPRRTKPKPVLYSTHVRNILSGMDAEKGTADWVRELSSCLTWIGQSPQSQTAAFIRAAYRPQELLFSRRASGGTIATPGVNIRTTAEWLRELNAGKALPGECITINPLTGKQGKTHGGELSYRSLDCIADFPFVLVEFDDMPLPMQYTFWRGFLLTHILAPSLVSLTYSGGKSLHGLLNAGCHTRDEWDLFTKGDAGKKHAGMVGMFAADPDNQYRIDQQALAIDKAVRLPGVIRPDTGKVQELLYLNPEARSGNSWTLSSR